MKKLLCVASCLLMFMGVMAQSTVVCSVDGFSISPGEKKTIAVNLANPDNPFCAFQFDMQLPAGIEVDYDAESEKFKAEIAADRANGHSLNMAKVGDNKYRFLAFSSDFSNNQANSDIKGTSGALVQITIVAASDVELGEKTGSIIDAKFTPKSGTSVTFDNLSFNVTVENAVVVLGDANGDGVVDVADADYIIERIGADYDKSADVNNDGEVNVADADFVIERIK